MSGGHRREPPDRPVGAEPAGRGRIGLRDGPRDGLLGLQRSAGNQAVVQMLAAQVQREKVKHTTGAQLDTYASASPFLKTYVEAKIKGGTKADGHVHIHAPDAFKKAWVAYALPKQNPNTGAKFTEAEAEAFEARVNAFQDGTEIHIHEERGETGTAIHEAMHLFSSTAFDTLGFNMSEGSTEFFARVIYAEQKITRGAFYTEPYGAVAKLVEATSKDALAKAYFNGDLKGLEDAVEAKKKGTWQKWLDHMRKGQYADANRLW